jgi:hypothetical protein
MSTPAAVRVTASQQRAAEYVLEQRANYPSMTELAAGLAQAVLTAEDPSTRHVVAVREPGGVFYVFAPYATHAAALKVLDAGLATREGARGGVFPLIPAPKSPTTAQEIKPPKKATPRKRVTA